LFLSDRNGNVAQYLVSIVSVLGEIQSTLLAQTTQWPKQKRSTKH